MTSQNNANRERQSMLTMRVVIIILSLFAFAYFALNIYESMHNPVKTVEAVYGSSEDLIPLSGWFVRDEELLKQENGVMEVLTQEGGRVGKGQVIAEVYDSEQTLENKRILSKLNSQISQLEDAVNSSSDVTNSKAIEESLLENILTLEDSVFNQNFLNLETETSNVRALVFKWDYAFADKEEAKQMLEQLKAQRDQLESGTSQSAYGIRVQSSGTYSSMVDGYETILTPDVLENLTPEQVASWDEMEHDFDSGEYIGKLVRGFVWYYIAPIDYELVKTYETGDTVSFRLTSENMEPFNVEIESIGEPNEEGKCVIVFRSNSFMSNTTALRRENIDLITDTYDGIKIPKESVRMDEDGNTGVYGLMGLQARWRQVEIVYEADTYYLSEYMPNDTSYVRAGDQVLVSSKDMYDGKIID